MNKDSIIYWLSVLGLIFSLSVSYDPVEINECDTDTDCLEKNPSIPAY